MDATEFKAEIESALHQISYVQSVSVQVEGPIASGNAYFSANCFVSVYYNSQSIKLSFALMYNRNRIWAIDRDNRFGWHRHPLYNVQVHETIDEMTVQEIITELSSVLQSVL